MSRLCAAAGPSRVAAVRLFCPDPKSIKKSFKEFSAFEKGRFPDFQKVPFTGLLV
jgi:hypothetical protein